MPKFDMDISTGNTIPDGDYDAVVAKLTYQIKTGEKWNAAGTQDLGSDEAAFDEMVAFDGDKAINYQFNIPGKGGLFTRFYLKDSAKGFLHTFFKKCGVNLEEGSFDPEDVLNKDVGLKVVVNEGGYNEIKGFYQI